MFSQSLNIWKKTIILWSKMVNETLQILTLLIGNQEEVFSIRKISRLRDINYKSAYKAVHALEQKGLARLQRIGNTITCSFTQKFDEMVFHAESMRRDELLRNKDFLVLHNRLDALPFPFIALLFGSYAKGTATKHSDIDILTIGGDQKEIKATLSLLPDKIHLTPVAYQDCMAMAKSREFTVVSEALKKNVILLGIGEYYRMLKNAH